MYVKLMEIGFDPDGFAERHAFDIRDGFGPFGPLSCQRGNSLTVQGYVAERPPHILLVLL
jgi:hypothetical protein